MVWKKQPTIKHNKNNQMVINFWKNRPEPFLLCMDGVDRIQTFKLFGVNISEDLTLSEKNPSELNNTQ